MIPPNPFEILEPNERWAPSQEQVDLFQNVYENKEFEFFFA